MATILASKFPPHNAIQKSAVGISSYGVASKTPQSLFLISSNASICVDKTERHDPISHTSKAIPNITFLFLDNEEEQLVSSRAPFLWAERRNMHLFVEVQNCVEFQFLKYLSFQGIGGVQTNYCDWYYGMVATKGYPILS